VLAGLFITLMIIGIFAADAVRRRKRDNAWKNGWDDHTDGNE
jgi:hypothetical protein